MKTIALSLLTALLSLGSWATEPEKELVAADKNGDGRVSLQEFKKYRVSAMKEDGWSDPYAQIKEEFRRKDWDEDGYLDADELCTLIHCDQLRDAFRAREGQMTYKVFLREVKRMLSDQGDYALCCQVKQQFKELDDGDHVLSRYEYLQIPGRMNLRFKLADEDENGELDIDEFEIYAVGAENLELLNGKAKGWVENIFENRDEDEDGYLTKSDIYETSEERARQFTRADQNSDGYLGLAEMQALCLRNTDISMWRDMAMDQYRLNFINRDRNADGVITTGEYFSAPRGNADQIVFYVAK